MNKRYTSHKTTTIQKQGITLKTMPKENLYVAILKQECTPENLKNPADTGSNRKKKTVAWKV